MAGYFIDPEEEQAEQPQDGSLINWEGPFCRGIQAVFNGNSAFTDVASGKQWTNVGLTFTKNPQGMAAVCNQASAYASRTQAIPPNSPGWTVAAAFVPISYSAVDHAIVGFCQSPKATSYDRSILNGTGGVPQGYLYDGTTAKKILANGPAMVSGVPEVIVVTATTSFLTIYRKGYDAASLAVTNSGYTGYTGTPAFCVGAASNVAGQSDIALAVLANRPWSAKDAQEWIANPAKIFVPPPIDIWAPSAGGGVTIDCTPGNAVAAGIACAVTQDITIACSVGNAVAAGITASLPVTITASVGNAVAAGTTASVTQAVTINTTLGNAVAAGVTAVIELGAGITINAAVGNAVAAGITASILQDFAVLCGVGNAVAAGATASISLGDPLHGFTQDQLDFLVAYMEANMAFPTTADIAAAVLAAAAIAPIASNVKKVNDRTIIGTGVPPTFPTMPTPSDPGDPFRVA